MSHPELASRTVGVFGGTGNQGRGLAYRWMQAGVAVVIGSRDAERAKAAAAELNAATGTELASGADNAGCAERSDVVLIAVPWEGHATLLESLREPLRDKIVIDCVIPLGFDERGPYPQQIDDGSAALQALRLLPESRLTAAFHHVSASLLSDPEVSDVGTDVLVLGDDREATDLVRALADVVPGMRGIYAGRLRNAQQVEALTANLIAINRRYRIGHAGIRVTGV